VRQTFDQKLQTLRYEALLSGHMADVVLYRAVEALICQDLICAHRVMADTCAINGRLARLESETLLQIAIQQPVARDLRMLAAVLKISAELGRMGGYAASIAQTTLSLAAQPMPDPFPQILLKMGEKARDMLRQSLIAFSERDIVLARTIPACDDEVDKLYNEVFQALMIVIQIDPSSTHQVACVSRAAHNLERTADRVINICEWVVFAVTGEMKELY
jgi:phosphate transport system protein